MSTRVHTPSMVWQPVNYREGIETDNFQGARITAGLAAALEAWRNTPYESGQRFAGRGCDCLGGVFGVVDLADGRQRAEYPNMPQDTSLHDTKSAVKAVRELIRRYSPCVKVDSVKEVFYVEPGDILITGVPEGGPGHVEIVGSRRNELWHALPTSGFHQGGWSLQQYQVLYAIYRIQDKWRWVR